jgi:carbon monoxide dehydrogenase subunit G
VAIRIEERFQVQAPAAQVFAYLVDPSCVVECLPGAELAEVVDARTFVGAVKVKVGAITVSYRGRVLLEEVDAAGGRVRMRAEGRESGGAGSAKMAMESRVADTGAGGAEVVVVAEVDVAGRIVQLGRGMFEQVAHQLFAQFATCVRARLEAAAAPATAGATTAPSPARAPGEAVAALPLLMKALWAWVLSLFSRGRPGARR